MDKVLIIDDESTIVMVLEEILEYAGYEVFTAPNGLEGLELIRDGLQPSLIIIDLLMPIMGGRDFLIKLNSDFKEPEIKVILLTGSIPNEKDFPPAETYNDIICKPFNIDDITVTIERLLKKE